MLLEELNTLQKSNSYVLFLDLDGVLSNFVKGMKKLIPDYSEEKYLKDSKYRSKMWKTVNEYTKEGGKLWAELEVMPDGHQLWDYVKKYNPEILTATGDPTYGAGEQKREWFPRKFGTGTKINIVRKSKEKAQHAASNHILIDDMSKSIDPWIKAGGIGILHTSASNTISELKKLKL